MQTGFGSRWQPVADATSRASNRTSWQPKSKVSLRTESGFGVRREVGRDDADQERSQNWTATIRRLSARADVGRKPLGLIPSAWCPSRADWFGPRERLL